MANNTTPQKTCTKCNQTFPATKEYFHKRSASKDGLTYRCKTCGKKRARQWREENPEKAAECAKQYREEYGVDGIMIGRGAIGNPWIFNQIKHYFKTGEELAPPTLSERMDAVRTHLKFSIEWKGDKKGIFEMRRHYTNYFRGIPGFKPFRARLVESPTYEATLDICDEV